MKRRNSPIAYPVVVLVGVGEIGSRHLQGLARCDLPLRIFAVDPDPERIKVAVSRWKEVYEVSEGIHRLNFCRLRDVPERVDIAIVATSATIRLEVAQSLARGRKVKSWIFEKWITNKADELPEFLQLCSESSQGWVNFPRRVMSWYKEISQQCELLGSVEVEVKLRPEGLFTNSIHFVDLVEHWTGENVVSSNWGGSELHPTASKRNGFVDSCGQMIATFSGGSHLKVASKSGTHRVFPSLWASWRTDSLHIDEKAGLAIFGSGGEVLGQINLQSELTGPVIEEILLGKQCHFGEIERSLNAHRVLLRDIDNWWKLTSPSTQGVFPIT